MLTRCRDIITILESVQSLFLSPNLYSPLTRMAHLVFPLTHGYSCRPWILHFFYKKKKATKSTPTASKYAPKVSKYIQFYYLSTDQNHLVLPSLRQFTTTRKSTSKKSWYLLRSQYLLLSAKWLRKEYVPSVPSDYLGSLRINSQRLMSSGTHTPNFHFPNSRTNSQTPNSHTPSHSQPLQPPQPEPLLLLLIYTRRPIENPAARYTPPILRSLERRAIYENHIRMVTSQLRSLHPSSPLVQVDVDLGFPFAGLEHRLRACFGDTVREMRFEHVIAGSCTWNGEQSVVRELIRGFKIVLR
jgi:hypothetical protein